MPTSLRRLAALLDICKAGGGYVPLDPPLPADRLAFMIADTGMTAILTDTRSAGCVPDPGPAALIHLDARRAHITHLGAESLTGTGVTAADLAYVLYTSGSTGQPKGVAVEHRHVVNLLHG